MKNLKVIIAVFGLVFMISACAPLEEVEPQSDQQKLEKFDVKNEETPSNPPRGK